MYGRKTEFYNIFKYISIKLEHFSHVNLHEKNKQMSNLYMQVSIIHSSAPPSSLLSCAHTALTSETTGGSSQTGLRKRAPSPAAPGRAQARSWRRVWAPGWRRCSASCWRWSAHKQLITLRCIDWRKMCPWTNGQTDNPTPPTTILLPLHTATRFLPYPYCACPSDSLGWYLYSSHRAHLWRDCLPASPRDGFTLSFTLYSAQGNGQSHPYFQKKTVSPGEVM